jgi:hypothetical protein
VLKVAVAARGGGEMAGPAELLVEPKWRANGDARFAPAQKRQRVAPCGSAVATPKTVWNRTRNTCHGAGPVPGAL